MSVSRAVGDFAGRTLVGSFDPLPSTCSHDAQPFGLFVDGTYFYGTFRDESGNPSTLLRRIATAGDTAGLTLVHSPDPTSDMNIVAETARNTFVGRARQAITEDEARYRGGKAYPHPDRGLDISVRASEFTWTEGDELSLSGRIVGPGLQFFSPWSTGAVFYLSRLWRAHGTLRGRPVSGFVGIDQLLSRPGISWGHDPLSNKLELSWYTWGNEYDDGTVEVGHIAHGHGHWGFAMFNTPDGELCRSVNIESEVAKRDEAGWPQQVTYTIDGQEWEWVAEPRGRMPELGLPGQRVNPQSEGQFRRVGEQREIRSWFAWGETIPQNGDRRLPAPSV